ncbi:MAG: exodeoxyribonuclease V subunit alpha, partial [Candidatus Schmidhempelia sp.]|nr:exodeoxyribonuclease V subunit alpha [Candidatus Schmidhempelia sp.]
MEILFKQLVENNIFSVLDIHLSKFLTDKTPLVGQNRRRLLFLISYLSAETRAGHVCLKLTKLNSTDVFNGRNRELSDQIWIKLNNPCLSDWIELLSLSTIASNGQRHTPLIFQDNRLYFQRMWCSEQKVANFFRQTCSIKLQQAADLSTILTALFPEQQTEIDWQKVAVAMALTRQVAIISGGPGTGKTTTVAKLLAALIATRAEQAPALRIMAAAPTGKAAARLTQSLNVALDKLTMQQNAKLIMPNEAITLHRLLGAQLHQQQFVHHKENPLHLDILIIDEASMVDLSMMASLIDALPTHARLILLGDREQLSSVEAGAVLGDLCYFANNNYSQARVRELSELTGYSLSVSEKSASIADNICLLQKSYRFDQQSGIGQLAAYVRQGKSQLAMQLLIGKQYKDIAYHSFCCDLDYPSVIEHAVMGYSHYLQYIQQSDFDIPQALSLFSRFRLLSALREGAFGVNGLNYQIEQALTKQKLLTMTPNEVWYLGRPVMILKNHSGLGLYNGDIGITLPSKTNPDKKRVYFQLADGRIQGFSPYRLPLHETAFVMTVHKSQGSEF